MFWNDFTVPKRATPYFLNFKKVVVSSIGTLESFLLRMRSSGENEEFNNAPNSSFFSFRLDEARKFY